MIDSNPPARTAADANQDLWRSPLERGSARRGHGVAATTVVPIRSLGMGHRERIAVHLLALDAHDRYLRFGYSAADRHIRDYADSLDFERDDIFGIYNRKLELIAMAHLAYSVNPEFRSCAEFGVSVLQKSRGRGFGARLFERATMHASNEGVELLFVHALSENTAMLKIARRAGAVVERDGAESQAFLRLPAATLDSRMSEMVAEQLGRTDYQLKTQAKHFWDLLEGLQNVRQGVRDGRRKSAM